MKRKRVAIVTTHPIQYHAPWFSGLAAYPGIDLEVFFCHRATPTEQASAGFGVEFEWDVPLLEGFRSRFLKNVAVRPTISAFAGLDTPEIKEIISARRFDVVVVNGWHYKSAWQAMRACWRTGIPVMARSDSNLKTQRNGLKRLVKWPVYKSFIPRLDGCLAVGTWSRDYFLHYGAQPDRVFIVPHAIDDRYFSARANELYPRRKELRANWGFDEESAVFIFAGKLIEKKRPLDFLRALEIARRRGVRASGLVVGDGPLRSRCERFVEERNLNVRFTGFLNQTQMAQAYVAADALVLPSSSETWGLVVNEAMACGRPCFVSDRVGCGPDLILSNETGALFPKGDVEALANLLTSVAASPELLVEMGRRAARLVQEKSMTSAIERLVAAVETVGKGL